MKKRILLLVFFSMAVYHGYATRPTVNASNFTASNIQCNQVKLNWTSGNGAARVIIGREGGLTTFVPADGDQFNQNPAFGKSVEYPTSAPDGNFILYNGNGTNFVIIDSLKPGKTYYFVIYEHDNNGNLTEYLTAGATTLSVTTYDINLNFTIKSLDSCQMTNNFEFTNNSVSTIPGISYQFDFGDGTSTSSPVQHHFNAKGYVNVKLTPVTTIKGCPNLFQRNVKIFPKTIAFIDYSSFKDTQCLEGNFYQVKTKSPAQPFPMGVKYKWFFGDGDSNTFAVMKHTYKTSGKFNVMLELNSTSYSIATPCKDTQRFTVTVLPSPVGAIDVNDTFQCLGVNKFQFNNPDNTLSYFKWYFGDADSSDQKTVMHRYADTGTYRIIHVAYANTGCKGRDTFFVKVLPDLDSRFSGLDTLYCESKVADLLSMNTAGGTFIGYPVSGNSLVPDQIGSYNLSYIIRDKYCSDTTTKAFRIAPTPVADLGRDTAICARKNFTLDARTSGKYLWNTGDTTKTIVATGTGKYSVTVTVGPCSAFDSVFITFSTAPKTELGRDTILCKGGGLWLKASYPKSSYLWSNGSTDSAIYVHQAGKYVVTVSNPCGTFEDSIFINFAGDYCDLFMPNAFTPGNDWINNVFIPRGRGITVQLFQIYNRWGELIFETDQDGVGWDGTYKGEICQDGLYIWKLFYTTENGPYLKKSNATGQVILFR